jgi:beta-galactosidase
MCDLDGLWVIDDCNYETHGFDFVDFRCNPTDDDRWVPASLNRGRRRVGAIQESPFPRYVVHGQRGWLRS